MQARWILHADMDAFYASIEQRDQPSLRGKPVIVGATSPRGVVAAASYEARRFGVRSAMPGFRAKALCPDGIYLPPDMARYRRVSDQVHRIFADFTPEIEPLSLDEAFLDIGGSLGLFGTPLALARKLKARVRSELGLAVSVGIAETKLVAKIACTLSKPDGLLWVPPEAVRWLLDPLPVRRLWGVGPVLAEKLKRVGILKLGDLADLDAARLVSLLGERGLELQQLARGHDARSVQSNRAPKSYGEENTFEQDVSDDARVSAAITAHSEAVARRMRRDHYSGRTVTLKIKLGRAEHRRRSRTEPGEEPRYPLLSRSKTLPGATDDASVIRAVALELWRKAAVKTPIRLLGVSVSGLVQSPGGQLGLFEKQARETSERSRRLGFTLDAIQERFGRGAIGRAVPEPDKLTPTSQRKRGE